nr:hypothetical protein [uncultured Rhodopila sp.]
MALTDDEERELKVRLMKADIDLKEKQAFWETPRNIAILVGAVAALLSGLVGTVTYLTGYSAGQRSVAGSPQIIFQPGAVVVPPPPQK